MTVPLLVRSCEDFWKVVENVERANVELVNGQNGGVTADNKRQITEPLNPVRDPNWKLPARKK